MKYGSIKLVLPLRSTTSTVAIVCSPGGSDSPGGSAAPGGSANLSAKLEAIAGKAKIIHRKLE